MPSTQSSDHARNESPGGCVPWQHFRSAIEVARGLEREARAWEEEAELLVRALETGNEATMDLALECYEAFKRGMKERG